MGCDAIEDRLLDLVYEELPQAEATEVREHVETCDACKRSLARLSSAKRLATHMPLETPPRSMDAKILAAARAKVGAPEVASRTDEDEGWLAKINRFLGSFAVGPQAAMATVMLLVVAIGIWYVPRLDDETSPSSTVVSVDPNGEAAPSGGVEPSPPLDLALDPHTRRIRPRDELEAIAQAAAEQRAENARRAQEQAETAPTEEEAPGAPPEAQALDGLARLPAAPPGEDDFADEGGAFRYGGATDLGSGGGDAPANAGPTGVAPDRSPRGGSVARLEDNEIDALQGSTEGEALDLREAPRDQPVAQERESATRGRRPAPARAAEPMATSAPSVTPTVQNRATADSTSTAGATPASMLAAARASRSSGQCATAVTQYRALLAQFPQWPQRGQAMIEAAECYRRMGRIADANRMLDAAERIPSSTVAARRARVQSAPSEAAAAETSE